MSREGQLRDLEMRSQRSERERKQYWAIPPLNKNSIPPTSYNLQVSSTGQQLYTGTLGTIRGIFNSATALTVIPTAAPSTGSTYTNGLGGGYLINADGTLGAEVWLANQPLNPGTGAINPSISMPLPQYATVCCLIGISMPVSGGGFTTVYQPFAT